MSAGRSVPPEYFEEKYIRESDPWGYATQPYEAAKYQATIAALTRPRYTSAFEIGCSIGVLSKKLAAVSDALLAVDVSATALERARERCRDLPHVHFALMRVPREFPAELFDLIVVSEVGYYWSRDDLEAARQLIVEHLLPGGELLLVHWTPPIHDAPLSGDAVHDAFASGSNSRLRHVTGYRVATYRLDLLEKRG